MPSMPANKSTGKAMTGTSHRGRRALAESVKQRALAAIESWSNGATAVTDTRKGSSFQAAAIMAAIEAAGLRIVEAKRPAVRP